MLIYMHQVMWQRILDCEANHQINRISDCAFYVRYCVAFMYKWLYCNLFLCIYPYLPHSMIFGDEINTFVISG